MPKAMDSLVVSYWIQITDGSIPLTHGDPRSFVFLVGSKIQKFCIKDASMICTEVWVIVKNKQGLTISEMPSREVLLATGNQSQDPGGRLYHRAVIDPLLQPLTTFGTSYPELCRMSPARRSRPVCIDQIHGLPASFSIHSGPDSRGQNASPPWWPQNDGVNKRKIWCCGGLLQPPVMKNLRPFLHQKCRHFGRIDHSESRRDL